MRLVTQLGGSIFAATVLVATLPAADIKVDLSKERVGRVPATFEPMVGTWVVAQDGKDKVVMVDGRPWVANKDNPTKLLIQSARKLYGTTNEELMDNAKQFAYYPVAVLRSVNNFSDGTISMKFKTIGGESDSVLESSSTSSPTATGWRSAITIRKTTSPSGNSTTASGGPSDSATVPNHFRWTGAHGMS